MVVGEFLSELSSLMGLLSQNSLFCVNLYQNSMADFPMFSAFCNVGSTALKAPQGNSQNALHLHPGTIFP